jgi:predicted permease
MSNFVIILVSLALGYTLRRTKFAPENLPNLLNKIVIYIALPAMILLQIPKLTLSLDDAIPIMIAWTVMTISALLVWIIARIFTFSREITGALLLVTPLGNTSFLGIPIIEMYYGQEGLPYLLLYDQFGTFLALSFYGTFIVSFYAHGSVFNARTVLKKLFTFPPFIFLLIAFALHGVTYSASITMLLSALAATIPPLAITAVGLQLQLKLPKHELPHFSLSLIIKLLLAPVIALGMSRFFGWNDAASNIAIMEAAMPSMITAGAMASMAGLAPRLSSAIVGYGILISLLTTYLWYLII